MATQHLQRRQPSTTFADLHHDLQCHVLLFADVASLVAVKAACTALRHCGRAVLLSPQWLSRGGNREDMRHRLWRGVDLCVHAPHVIVAHAGHVWSLALSSEYLVSAAEGEVVLQVRDASRSSRSNDCAYRRVQHAASGRSVDGVTLSRSVLSWHLALRGHQLAVLGRLVDLSRLREGDGQEPDRIVACPLTLSMAAWSDAGRLFLTQDRAIRVARHPPTDRPADSDVAGGIVLEDRVLRAGGPPPARTHGLAAGTLSETLSFVAVTSHISFPDQPAVLRHRAITVLTVDTSQQQITITAVRRLQAHHQAIYALATANDRLASGSDDLTVKLWNPFAQDPAAQLLATINTGAKVWALAMSGDLLVSGGAGNAVSNVNVWSLRGIGTFHAAGSVRSAVRLASLRGMPEQGVRSLVFDGDRVVAGADDGRLYVWHHDGLPL